MRNRRDARGRFVSGMIPWNKGRRMSRASRLKESSTKRLFFKLGASKPPRLGVKLSKDIKQKISISKKLLLKKHPEIGLKHSAYMRRYWKKHPEKVARHRKFLVKYWRNPERRERARRISKEVYRNHPELREASRKRFIKWLILHKDALRLIEQSKGNRHSLKKITLKGEKVRSLYEVIVANWLLKNDVRYFYEGKMFVFPHYKKLGIVFAVPDFFLPDYNAIVEIYGGYPGTRGKNTRKSRAYAYYGIPFLALTPSDMGKLDYEIKGFLGRTGKNPKLGREARRIMWGMLD